MKLIELSPSALNLFMDCPRCFWLEKNRGIRRPRGIFPSLPGGMDMAIKAYFDGYRSRGELPPELRGKVQGKLFPDAGILKRWRSAYNKKDPCHMDRSLNAILYGALDDCLVDGDHHIPLDYKTRGFELKDNSASYYENQLSCYALMLESSGYPVLDFAYLVFYWPAEVRENGIVRFNVNPVRVAVSTKAAKDTFRKAVLCLSSTMPESGEKCEYCPYLNLASHRQSHAGGDLLL